MHGHFVHVMFVCKSGTFWKLSMVIISCDKCEIHLNFIHSFENQSWLINFYSYIWTKVDN